jgi:thiosulfate dehydrogenase [quinone] large subunit
MIRALTGGRRATMSDLNEFSQKKTAHLWPITLLRIYTGMFFLKFGFAKVGNPDFAKGLTGFVTGNLENSFGFMRGFLESVVLANTGVFAFLVSWGEVLIGFCLIVGLATRYAAIAGALMVAAFWFTKGQEFLDGQNHDAMWFVIFIVLATVHAGRQHSLDEKLKHTFRFLR